MTGYLEILRNPMKHCSYLLEMLGYAVTQLQTGKNFDMGVDSLYNLPLFPLLKYHAHVRIRLNITFENEELKSF
jgi:hypothetical protein